MEQSAKIPQNMKSDVLHQRLQKESEKSSREQSLFAPMVCGLAMTAMILLWIVMGVR